MSFSVPPSYTGRSVAPGRASGPDRLAVRSRTKKQPVGPPGLLGFGLRADNSTSLNYSWGFKTPIKVGETMTQIRAEAP